MPPISDMREARRCPGGGGSNDARRVARASFSVLSSRPGSKASVSPPTTRNVSVNSASAMLARFCRRLALRSVMLALRSARVRGASDGTAVVSGAGSFCELFGDSSGEELTSVEVGLSQMVTDLRSSKTLSARTLPAKEP